MPLASLVMYTHPAAYGASAWNLSSGVATISWKPKLFHAETARAVKRLSA